MKCEKGSEVLKKKKKKKKKIRWRRIEELKLPLCCCRQTLFLFFPSYYCYL